MKTIALLLTCLSLTAYSQDYLVTLKADTLQGEIKPLPYDRLERVQITQDKKKTVLSGMEVRIYSYKGDLYQPIQYENSIRFMKILKSGYLSLYAFRLENQNTMEGRLLVRLDGAKLEVPNINFKRAMASFVKDCPEVQQKINIGDYGRRDLEKVIADFNNCAEGKREVVKKTNELALESSRKITPLENLRNKVSGLPDFGSKKDALDLLRDMIDKVTSFHPIANYELEALKGFLQGNESVKEDLEKVLSELRNP